MGEIPFFDGPSESADDEPRYVVVYRDSDALLADAFDTDVPVLAWGRA